VALSQVSPSPTPCPRNTPHAVVVLTGVAEAEEVAEADCLAAGE
jgi:hypothetical protein